MKKLLLLLAVVILSAAGFQAAGQAIEQTKPYDEMAELYVIYKVALTESVVEDGQTVGLYKMTAPAEAEMKVIHTKVVGGTEVRITRLNGRKSKITAQKIATPKVVVHGGHRHIPTYEFESGGELYFIEPYVEGQH